MTHWSRKVCPNWLFTIFDLAERAGVSVRHCRRLIKKFDVPTGMILRPVKLRNGKIVRRRVLTLTQTSLDKLLMQHAGLRLSTGLPSADTASNAKSTTTKKGSNEKHEGME